MVGTTLNGKPYMMIYTIPAGTEPIITEFEATDDEEAKRYFEDSYQGTRGNAKLYKLLLDNEKK